MPMHGSIVDEIVVYDPSGSTEKRLDAAKRVTGLFLTSAAASAASRFRAVRQCARAALMAKTIELRSIAAIAPAWRWPRSVMQLAPIAQAPPSVIRRSGQARLKSTSPDPFCGDSRTPERSRPDRDRRNEERAPAAVSGRWWLKESCDRCAFWPAIIQRSAAGSWAIPAREFPRQDLRSLWRRRKTTAELAVEAGSGWICPRHCAVQLLRRADGGGSKRCCTRATAPSLRGDPQRHTAAAASADREMSKVRDFAAARRFVATLAQAANSTRRAVRIRQAEEIRGDRRCTWRSCRNPRSKSFVR